MSKTIRRKNCSAKRFIDLESSPWWQDSFRLNNKPNQDYRSYVKDAKCWFHSDLPGRGVGDHASLPRSIRNWGQERPFRRQVKQMIHRFIVDGKEFSLKRPKRDTWLYY